MAINNRDKQSTRVLYVPVNTGGGSGGGSQAKIKVGESGIKLTNSTFTEVPQIFDFSDVTDMTYMFDKCESLTTISEMNTANVTDMRAMFNGCNSLTTIPKMDTSKVTSMSYMFGSCYLLTTIPEMDTSQVTNMGEIFYECPSLTTIPEMDTSKVTYIGSFYGSGSLTDLGGFVGLKVNLNLSGSSKLTHDSIMNIINKAADVTENPKTMTFGETNLAKLSDEEKGIATAKGWTLA